MNHYRVPPHASVDLSALDPEETSQFPDGKEAAQKRLLELNRELDELQEVLYAEHRHKVLVILQAMDTGGKDGTVRRVFEGVNPQGVRVVPFKVPTPVELDHDYLWRAHQQVPGKGEIVVFNRSYYEDVLVVRVHKLVPPEVWKRRYAQINAFEQMLAEEGCTILKFFLHIDLDEQKHRLQERLDDPRKRWKFNPADLEERKLWADYMQAYQDMLNKTSTSWAPWYTVPANRNWYRDWIVAETIVATLKDLKLRYPDPPAGLDQVVIA